MEEAGEDNETTSELVPERHFVSNTELTSDPGEPKTFEEAFNHPNPVEREGLFVEWTCVVIKARKSLYGMNGCVR